MKLIYTFIFLFSQALIFSQSISIRGKVIDIEKQPVKNLPIRFTSFGESVTTGSGEFVITIPQSVQFIDLVLRDENWQLLYPVDAKIPVPADPNFVTTVIVSKSNSSTGKNLDESMVKYNELESILKDVGTTNTELKSFFEKFIELESKRLEISEAELRDKFERKEKRNIIFDEVSPVLKEYCLRVNNLKTTFEMYYESAFVSNPSVEHLNNAIRLYNPVYDTIYNNYNNWQNEISSAWDANLSEKFASSLSYMIDDVHKSYIFQLNENVKLINDVRLKIGEGESNPQELKSKVIRDVSAILKNLDVKIPILENRFNEIITRMQHSDLN
jgi:hypothetical protein